MTGKFHEMSAKFCVRTRYLLVTAGHMVQSNLSYFSSSKEIMKQDWLQWNTPPSVHYKCIRAWNKKKPKKQELSADSIACLELGWYWSVRVLFRTSLIWVCTVCLGLTVPILRIITVRGNVMAIQLLIGFLVLWFGHLLSWIWYYQGFITKFLSLWPWPWCHRHGWGWWWIKLWTCIYYHSKYETNLSYGLENISS